MTQEERLFDMTERIAVNEERTSSAHKRLDNLDELTKGIHRLASSVEGMSSEIKGVVDVVAGVRDSQRDQGKRLGKLEKTVESLPWIKEKLDDKTTKLDEVRQEPAKKWKMVVGYVIGGAITLAIGLLAGGLLYQG